MVHVIDAENLVLGRLASHVAQLLLDGEEVVVVNAERALITGEKEPILERYRFKREVGSQRKGPFYPRMPHLILKRTVRGMLPYQKPRGREALKRLTVHIGVPHEVDATPESVEAARTDAHRALNLGEVARHLGASF